MRRAISELAGEGLLSAAHGRGTFVRPRPDRRTINIGGPDQPSQPTPRASARPEPSKDVEPPDNIDEPEYEPREQDYGTTLYKILTTQHGPVSFTASVTARMPRGDELDELGIELGTPVLQVRRTMTDTYGRPLETTLIEATSDRFDAAADTTTGDQNAIMTL